jgi:hypothetical protein
MESRFPCGHFMSLVDFGGVVRSQIAIRITDVVLSTEIPSVEQLLSDWRAANSCTMKPAYSSSPANSPTHAILSSRQSSQKFALGKSNLLSHRLYWE